jgi:hypothetical protein
MQSARLPGERSNSSLPASSTREANMTKLVVKDKVLLGEYLIRAATDPDEREKLSKNPNEQLKDFVEIPEGHTIVVNPEAYDTTHLVLPTAEDVSEALSDLANMRFCAEYDSASAQYIDPKKDPLKALRFRIGDHVLSRCRPS